MMEFQSGDKVVHCVYGVGEIIQIEKKILAGRSVSYYRVQIRDLTLWVPINGTGRQSLRLPTSASQFEERLQVLGSTGELLSEDRLERKTQLAEQMKNGTLESLCCVIRDITSYGRSKKLNDNDHTILERAKNLLLEEWVLSLSVPLPEAQRDLRQILEDCSRITK